MQRKFNLLSPEESETFCKENGIVYLGLFGSYARGEENFGSDVDLLVRFDKNSKVGLFGLLRMQEELKQRMDRPVELITKLNKYIKPHVLKDMVTLYEKR